MHTPKDSPHWQTLLDEAAALGAIDTPSLFAHDPARAETFAGEAAGLYLDYSKNRLSRRALKALLGLAEDLGLPAWRDRMLRGEPVNVTENRAVLHTALRAPAERELRVDGVDVIALARAERERLLAFVERVHRGAHRGASGRALSTVVNIGIGGSDLGPSMAVEALRAYWLPGRRSFFVSNVDGQHLADVLAQIDPATTLFVVASKTFSTQETMTNARSAVNWFLAQGFSREAIGRHFVALSSNTRAAAEFGIAAEQTFGFWDWVGGRYSLCSSIGLSVALQVGGEAFLALLAGAQAMDAHFQAAPLDSNLPVLLALVGIWNRNFEGIGAHAILPYDQRLHRLPAYLQQADMESNGKSVRLNGEGCDYATGPVIFGEPGTNAQHAFYQLLHQGSERLSADFIVVARPSHDLGEHHRQLLANALAQPRALMLGKTPDAAYAELIRAGVPPQRAAALAPHKRFGGSRPSNVILMDRLTPQRLGALLALYEHKIFCQGAIWGINSFDQWGVELGKQLAGELLPLIDAPPGAAHRGAAVDPSTEALLRWINERRR